MPFLFQFLQHPCTPDQSPDLVGIIHAVFVLRQM